MSSALLAQDQLPPRSVAVTLRRRVMDYLRVNRPAPGSRLATEAEFVRSLKVSRSTVRRALDPLEKEGWINRRAGAGTFVGPRVRELDHESPDRNGDAAAGHVEIASTPADTSHQLRARRDRGIVRVAVLIYNIGDLAHDWYTPGILQGLDDAGQAHHVVVELLGDRGGDTDALSRRLELSRPDVLVCLSNRPQHAFVIRDAQRLGIHCLLSGTPLAGLELPGVCEDNAQAMSLAVDRLLAAGHRRIGLALPRLVEPWVFERLQSYTERVREVGIEPIVHWTGPDAADSPALEAFIKSWRLTALIPGNIDSMRLLDVIVRSGRLSVPRDLSVVSFEQDHPERNYLGVADATRVIFPLREMGRRLAAMARALSEGQPAATFAADAPLGCQLVGEATVRDVRTEPVGASK